MTRTRLTAFVAVLVLVGIAVAGDVLDQEAVPDDPPVYTTDRDGLHYAQLFTVGTAGQLTKAALYVEPNPDYGFTVGIWSTTIQVTVRRPDEPLATVEFQAGDVTATGWLVVNFKFADLLVEEGDELAVLLGPPNDTDPVGTIAYAGPKPESMGDWMSGVPGRKWSVKKLKDTGLGLRVWIDPTPKKIQLLKEKVDDLPVKKSLKKTLKLPLDQAKEKLLDENGSAASGKMESFIGKVEAKKGKDIPEEDAEELIELAEEVRRDIEKNNPNR